MRLHRTQEAILSLLKQQHGNLKGFPSLRSIGSHLGIEDNPQVIAYHLDQLQNKGLIRQLVPNQYVYKVVHKPVQASVEVPLYRATAQCGSSGFFATDDIVDRIPVPTKMFGITNPSHFFFIKARGHSMEPLIHEGDLVLAHIQPDVDSEKIAVVVHENEPRIKRVKKLFFNEQRQHILLQSTNPNPEYPDIEVTEDSDFRICGLVKGVMRVQPE